MILPHFAELLARREWRACRSLHGRLTLAALAVGLTVAAIGAALSEPIIRLLFERGTFTADDSATAAAVMRAYLLQLPFALAAMVSLRALVALGETLAMTTIASLQLMLAAGFAYGLSQHYGIVGVAFGTALAAFAGCLGLGIAARRRFNALPRSLAA